MTANQARQDRPRAYVPRCAYTYTYTLVPYPTPCLPTYIHVYIIVYVCDDVCVYLIVFVFALFSLLLSLSLLLFSLFFFSCSLSPCLGKACLWAEAAGLLLSTYTSFFILFNYQPGVCMYSVYTCISLRQTIHVYVLLIVHASNRCSVCVQCVMYCTVYMRTCVCVAVYVLCCCSIDYLYIVCHGV